MAPRGCPDWLRPLHCHAAPQPPEAQSRREPGGERTMPAEEPSESPSQPEPPERAPAPGLPPLLLEAGRLLLLLLPVYMAGYLGLSLAFLLAGLLGYMGWRHRRRGKEQRALRWAQLGDEGEQEAVSRALGSSLPAWASFSDLEKVEWLNKILLQLWPYIGQYLEKLLVNTIATNIRSSNSHLQTFSFTKVDFGKKPLKVIAVKFQPTDVGKQQIILDLHLSYGGDVEINVEIKKFFCKCGVKGMQLHGMLRVILEPLIGDMPLVGAMTMFFIRRPTLELNWTGITNLLDIPGLSSMSDTMIMDIIASIAVLPNRLAVALVNDLPLAELRCPLPRGIVRIHLVEARNLPSKDVKLRGITLGKSDPYAKVHVGTQVFTSKYIDEELNPKWNEMYEAIVHEVPGQELEVEVFDKDPDKDDFLGKMKMDLGDVKNSNVLDKWYRLGDGEEGEVHLILQWMALMSNASKLEQVIQKNKDITAKTHIEPSSAFLAVYLHKAEDLPTKKLGTDPNPMVQMSVQDVTKESSSVQSSCNPVWEQPFGFFIQDPRVQDLDIQVKDDDRQVTLGSLTIPLSRLLSAEDMTLDQAFQLQQGASGSRIFMKLVLRVLFLKGAEPCLNPLPRSSQVTPESVGVTPSENVTPSDNVTASESGTVDMTPLPSITSPHANFGTETALRIHLLEAENLIAKDNFMKGMVKGKSDPYAVIRIAGKTFRSRVIKESLHPRWNEMFEVIVTDILGQEVAIEVFDKDIDKDDFLGRCKIDLTKVLSSRFLDEWIPLEDVKSGKLHLRLEALTASVSAESLDQALMVNSLTQLKDSEELSSAILTVYLEQAASLPMRKATKPPSPYAELSVRKLTYKTKTSAKTISPLWDETFSFLIKNPYNETLEMQVKDDGHQTLGSLSLPLLQLLKTDGLTLDRWVHLQNSDLDSQVLMRAQLRILSSQHLLPEVGALNLAVSQTPKAPPEPENQDLRHRGAHTDSSADAQEPQLGQIHLTVYVPQEERKLVVVVHSCRKLKLPSKEIPDPYVSLILQPDKNRVTKRKTVVKKKTVNPDFKERFEWEMSIDEVKRKQLEVSIKNSISFMSRERELIGKVYIDLSQTDLSSGLTQWFELQEDKGSI